MSLSERIASWNVEPVSGAPVAPGADALAASPDGRLVARVVPLSGGEAVDLFARTGAVTLGRSRALPVECQAAGGRVSAAHCRLHVDPATGRVSLADLSRHGTFVNGKRMQRGDAAAVELKPNDVIGLATAETAGNDRGDASGAVYVFQCEAERDADAVDKKAVPYTCVVCRGIYIRPCGMLPCLHVACAGCISKWVRNGNYRCFMCSRSIKEVRPNHKVQELLDGFLLENPSMRRLSEEVKESEAADNIPPEGLILRKRCREVSAVDPNGEAFENPQLVVEDTEVYSSNRHPQRRRRGCRHCAARALADGFRCPKGGQHQTCMKCHEPFPSRPLYARPQKCSCCGAPNCALYYEGEGGCSAEGGLMRLGDYRPPAEIPPGVFQGNSVERKILQDYLMSKGISVEALWEKCYDKLARGEWIPGIANGCGRVAYNEAICGDCIGEVFASLIFQYRLDIPRDELPESVSQRANCSSGKECGTQFYNTQHARDYNHACYQEKRKE